MFIEWIITFSRLWWLAGILVSRSKRLLRWHGDIFRHEFGHATLPVNSGNCVAHEKCRLVYSFCLCFISSDNNLMRYLFNNFFRAHHFHNQFYRKRTQSQATEAIYSLAWIDRGSHCLRLPWAFRTKLIFPSSFIPVQRYSNRSRTINNGRKQMWLILDLFVVSKRWPANRSI